MGDEWQQNPGYGPQDPPHVPESETPEEAQGLLDSQDNAAPQGPQAAPDSQLFNQENIDKRLEDIRRLVIQTAGEAQTRFKRVAGRANEYWQQASVVPEPRHSSNMEEERVRQLANIWSSGNWQVARELGNYMDIVSWAEDEAWEVSIQTRWETRSLETTPEPYTGRSSAKMQPILPLWDYELPLVTGLKAPDTRVRLEGNDEVIACTACNSTGHLLCVTCAGRGWIVCPDCKGRTKMRCDTCRGRGYVADWVDQKKKPFFQRNTERLTTGFNERVADVFDGIRQQGLPLPNPIDTDPAGKGRTVPCPDCVNGEVECTCGTGKRVCTTCQGARTELCANCAGTGKIVRHRELVRHFESGFQSDILGNGPLPVELLRNATGDLVYSAEITEMLYPEAPPEGVPIDVWRSAVLLVEQASQLTEAGSQPKRGKSELRASLQVLELVRIPYTGVNYRYNNQDYVFHIYDIEGKEKFYADRYPARWDRIERLVRSISTDLMAPVQSTPPANPASNQSRGYRVPIEQTPHAPSTYSFSEDDSENE
jgi:hypothetical protein